MELDLTEVQVFYINLDRDSEKRHNLEADLRRFEFKNVQRIPAFEDNSQPIVGLSKSQHLALSQVDPPFIILEDDVQVANFKRFLQVPDQADAIYLGISQWGLRHGQAGFDLKVKPVEGSDDLFRIYNMLSSHAIMYLSSDFVNVCRRTTRYCFEEYPLPMDVPYAMIQKFYNVYAFDAPLFTQRDYASKMTSAPKYTQGPLTKMRKPFLRSIYSRLFSQKHILDHGKD
jgi:hypothetical protein